MNIIEIACRVFAGPVSRTCLLVGGIVCSILLAWAVPSEGRMRVIQYPDPDELVGLPQYCIVQQFMWKRLPYEFRQRFGDGQEVLRRQWEDVLGANNFRHLHHYCWGLAEMRRILQPVEDYPEYELHRNSNLRGAIRNFDYVLERTDRDFLLRPEILLNKGRAFHLLGDAESAVKAFTASIQADPDFEIAYQDLADVLEEMGNGEEAARVLEVWRRRQSLSNSTEQPKENDSFGK